MKQGFSFFPLINIFVMLSLSLSPLSIFSPMRQMLEMRCAGGGSDSISPHTEMDRDGRGNSLVANVCRLSPRAMGDGRSVIHVSTMSLRKFFVIVNVCRIENERRDLHPLHLDWNDRRLNHPIPIDLQCRRNVLLVAVLVPQMFDKTHLCSTLNADRRGGERKNSQ